MIWWCRSDPNTVHSEFNTLPITVIHEQQLLILAHKIIHHSESVLIYLVITLIQMIRYIGITPGLN